MKRRVLLALACLLLATSGRTYQVIVRTDTATIERATRGRFGVAVLDARTGAQGFNRADDLFPLQSVYKTILALTALREAERGVLNLAAYDTIAPSGLVRSGSRIAETYSPAHDHFTRAELLRRAIIESDNTAAQTLLHDVGGVAALNRDLAAWGLTGISLSMAQPSAYTESKPDAQALALYAQATPRAVLHLFVALANGRLVNATDTAKMMALLTQVKTGAHRLRGMLPPAVVVAHKTGTGGDMDAYVTATNDAGIIMLPGGGRLFVVAFLADAKGSDAQLDAAIARLSRDLYHAAMEP